MKILRTIGLIIFLVALLYLMTPVFHALEDTIVKFFDLSQAAMDVAQASLESF